MWEGEAAGVLGPVMAANVTGPLQLVANGRYEVKMLGWNTPPEYMDYVDPYWKTFEAPNPAYHHMLGIIYIFFMFGSLVGNGVVMWIFSSAKSLQTPSNMLVINLAMLDFVMMVKTPIFIYNSFNEGPIFGKLGCDIFAMLGSFSGCGSAITNAMIAYDRYKTIAKPFDSKMSRTTAFAIVVFTWLFALPWTVLPYFELFGRFVPEGFLTTCTFDYMSDNDETRAFTAIIFFFVFCIPITMIIYFYGQIFSHVSAHEKAMREQAKRMNVTSLRGVGSKEDQEKSVECRIAKVAMTIVCLYFIAWTPYTTVALIAAFGDRSILTPLSSMIPACAVKMVACIDPWVYSINHPKYRLELQKKLPWYCIHEEKAEDTVSQVSDKT